MNRLLTCALLFSLIACKRNPGPDPGPCMLTAINYVLNNPGDTAYIAYGGGTNGELVSAINLAGVEHKYNYSNSRLVTRTQTYLGQTNYVDSIDYTAAGEPEYIVQRSSFPTGSFRRWHRLTWSGGKLQELVSYPSLATLSTDTAWYRFRWNGDDVQSIVGRDRTGAVLDSSAFTYAASDNPMGGNGVMAPLYNPGYDFLSDRFHVLALYYSRHRMTAYTRFFAGGSSTAKTVSMTTDHGQITELKLTEQSGMMRIELLRFLYSGCQ